MFYSGGSKRGNMLIAQGYTVTNMYEDRKEALEYAKKRRKDGYLVACEDMSVAEIGFSKTIVFELKLYNFKIAEYKDDKEVRIIGYSDSKDEIIKLGRDYLRENPNADVQISLKCKSGYKKAGREKVE